MIGLKGLHGGGKLYSIGVIMFDSTCSVLDPVQDEEDEPKVGTFFQSQSGYITFGLIIAGVIISALVIVLCCMI